MTEDFAITLRKIRLDKKMTLKEMASILGISFQVYKNYEYGRGRISQKRIDEFTVILEKIGIKIADYAENGERYKLFGKTKDEFNLRNTHSEVRNCRMEINIRPSTKQALVAYAERNKLGVNELIDQVLTIFARKEGESCCGCRHF